jgi:hypothetical protein
MLDVLLHTLAEVYSRFADISSPANRLHSIVPTTQVSSSTSALPTLPALSVAFTRKSQLYWLARTKGRSLQPVSRSCCGADQEPHLGDCRGSSIADTTFAQPLPRFSVTTDLAPVYADLTVLSFQNAALTPPCSTSLQALRHRKAD